MPARSKKRLEALKAIEGLESTLIFYESPKRIIPVMEDMLSVLGDRYAVLSREMTKAYEEFLRGPLSELVDELRNRQAVKGKSPC
ncbi:MAG: hypothetical protein R2860_09395 [Desulfobacterales bacterium]